MWKLKLKTDTALGVFRSALLVVLVLTVSISALVAIVGVLTDSFGQSLWKVVSTSGILAGLSFAILLQTFSLPRNRWLDKLNSAVGIPAATVTAFFIFDALYEWRRMETWFAPELRDKVTATFVIVFLSTSALGVLLSVSKSARSVRAALVTGGLLLVVDAWSLVNTWYPDAFNQVHHNQWGDYSEMIPFWQKFITIVGILLGAMAVLTFVLELVGLAHARRAAEGLTRLRGIDVELPEDVHARLAELASAAGISENELAAQLLEEALRR